MADVAKDFTIQIIDEDGAPAGLCYMQAFESTGVTRKAIWTDREKTLPSSGGSTADFDGDATGRVTFYGDGLYVLKFRAAGDDGSGTPLLVLYDVDLTVAEPVYAGLTDPWTLEGFEEDILTGQGRQAASTAAQSGTTCDLSLFDVAGSTYLVPGNSSLLTFQKVSVEDYEDGARITIECLTYPFKLRAKRAGEGSTYNLQIGGDFLMSVGSSIDLELRSGQWYERGRFFFDATYENLQNTGVASASTIIAPGRAVRVTGTTTINNIRWIKSGESAPPGQRLDLYFTAGAVVGDATGNCDLEGTFTGQAGATLSLISTGSGWKEITRTGYVAPNVTQTLASSTSPSVAGTWDVYYTEAYTTPPFTEIHKLTNSGEVGRIILIYFNGYDAGSINDGPAGTYTNSRKIVRHEHVGTEGYIRLKTGIPFQTLPGDWLRLQLLYDVNDVLYWQEIDRYENTRDIAPILEAEAALQVWRPVHTISVGSETVEVASINPVPNQGYRLSLIFGAGGGGNMKLVETGNIWVASGEEITMDTVTEVFILESIGATTAKNWVQIDGGAAFG